MQGDSPVQIPAFHSHRNHEAAHEEIDQVVGVGLGDRGRGHDIEKREQHNG
jgi:hypothetical protein